MSFLSPEYANKVDNNLAGTSFDSRVALANDVTSVLQSSGFTAPDEPVYDGDMFMGTNFVGPGPDADPYTLPDIKSGKGYLKPKDEVDAAAQKHDEAYWKAGASGVKGALFDKRVKSADIELRNSVANVILKYATQQKDFITNRTVSYTTFKIASAILVSFNVVVFLKN